MCPQVSRTMGCTWRELNEFEPTSIRRAKRAPTNSINMMRPRKLKIMSLRVNNAATKQKRRNICFALCHQYKTRSVKIKAKRTQQISVKTQVFGKN